MRSLNIELVRKWVVALRSGKYRQCRGSLWMSNDDGGKSYCCLGVLETLVIDSIELQTDKDGTGRLIDQAKLIFMNDQARKTFPEIADFIESEYLTKEEDKG